MHDSVSVRLFCIFGLCFRATVTVVVHESMMDLLTGNRVAPSFLMTLSLQAHWAVVANR